MNGTDLFERPIRERPDEPAFFYFDTPLSFAATGQQARELASALSGQLGLRRGDRVALMLQNVPQFPIAVHAVWLCGGVITSVNPMNKERELRHQLLDSGARLLICLESLFTVAKAGSEGTQVEEVITVSELDMLEAVPDVLADHERHAGPGSIAFTELLGVGRRSFEAVDVPSDSPALITYTSGTTGVPKGAINTHRAVVHSASAMTSWGSLAAGDVTVAMAPLFHITGLICHMATARASQTPLLMLYRFEAAEILRLIERWKGTYIIGPLTAFIAMLDHPTFSERDLSSLVKVASGGAPVYPSVVRRWEEATGTYMHNTYGMTETAAPTHLVPFGSRAPVDAESGALSIGLPVEGNESRIVSAEDGRELPDREEGEILTRGPSVTPGYWGRPEATAEVLTDGWLHTGDVGKRDAENWYYLVDRIKDMIVVSGYKVWPREVEDVLHQHPDILEAAVVGAPDDYRGEVPVAHVVLRRGAAMSERQLIEYCRGLLAVYKTPRRVVFAEKIPKTMSGKAMRRELRDPA